MTDGFNMNYANGEFYHERSPLSQNAQYFYLFFKCALNAMVITDEHGFYIEVNPAACQLFGLTHQQLLGRHINHFIESGFNFDEVWRTVQESGQERCELHLLNANGTPRVVECAAITNFLPHGCLLILHDITEDKQQEFALRQSDGKILALLNAIPDLMLRVSRDGTYLECKPPQGFQMLVPADEAIGKNEIEIFPPELAQQRQHYREQALTTGEVQIFEYQILMNGEIRYEEVRIAKSGEDEVLLIVRDITERKRAEQQLQASLAEKEVLLKEIHHRVKNNLQMVSSLLQLQAGYIQDPQALKMFQNSQSRIHTMGLIHEKFYQSQSLSKINLADYIYQLVNDICQTYSGGTLPNINFNLDIPHICFDIDILIPCGLIINELVSNALKHAFLEKIAGSVRISFYSLNTQQYLLIVKDDGRGLPADLDLSKTNSFGLSLVKTLVRQLNGTLKFYNQNGAVFQIEFPEPKT